MHSRFHGLWALSLALAAGLPPAAAEAATGDLPPPVSRPVRFVDDVKPILSKSCLNCHGKGRVKGGFRVDDRDALLAGGHSGPAIVPGKSAESLLIQLVAGLDPDNVMPQKGTRLTAEQVGLLRGWIDQGASWEEGFTFAKGPARNLRPRNPQVPSHRGHPVDALLLGPSGTTPQQVGDADFARRAHLDVIGLLPTPEDLRAFESDTRPDKRSHLVRTLLGRKHDYAEHWLSFWNDLLRNDYKGTGFIDSGRKQISGWLYDSLLTNKPYNRLVAELVNPIPESEGFVKGIIWRGAINASQTPAMQAAQNISQVFMGVNLKCASCHDSFIDDWRLSDAYGLAAVYHEGPLELFQCDKPTGQQAEMRFIYPELGSVNPESTKEERLQRLAELVTGPANGRLPRTLVNRLWSRFFGVGLVEPLDDMEQPSWNPDLLDWLAEDFVAHGYDIKHAIEVILTSQSYGMPPVDLGETPVRNFAFKGPAVRRLTAEQFRDAVAQITGVFHQRSDFGDFTNRVRASLVATDPLMTALGRPNREQVVTSRSSTATTLQALELTNGRTLTEILRAGAGRMAAQGSVSATESRPAVAHVYETALGRLPTPAEQEIAVQLVGDPTTPEGWHDLLWAITMLPEFQLIP